MTLFRHHFWVFLLFAYTVSLFLNTMFSLSQAFLEFKCYYGRPGSVDYYLQSLYSAQLLDPNNITGKQYSQVWVTQSGFQFYSLNETYLYTDRESYNITIDYEHNDKYFSLLLKWERSVSSLDVYETMMILLDGTAEVSEYDSVYNSTIYMSLHLTAKQKDCTITENFLNSWVYFYWGTMILVFLLFFLSYLGMLFRVFEFSLVLKFILDFLPFGFEGKFKFCNEITGGITKFRLDDKYVVLSEESVSCEEIQNFETLSAKIGECNVFVSGQTISFVEGKVFRIFELSDEKKVNFCKYLTLILTDPRKICVNDSLKHHYKIIEVLKFLESGGENIRLRIKTCSKPFVAADPEEKKFRDNFLYSLLLEKTKIGKDCLCRLVRHNRIFFKKTQGNDSALIKLMEGETKYFKRPDGVNVSQWKYYISDCHRILTESKACPDFLHKKFGKSKAYEEELEMREENNIEFEKLKPKSFEIKHNAKGGSSLKSSIKEINEKAERFLKLPHEYKAINCKELPEVFNLDFMKKGCEINDKNDFKEHSEEVNNIFRSHSEILKRERLCIEVLNKKSRHRTQNEKVKNCSSFKNFNKIKLDGFELKDSQDWRKGLKDLEISEEEEKASKDINIVPEDWRKNRKEISSFCRIVKKYLNIQFAFVEMKEKCIMKLSSQEETGERQIIIRPDPKEIYNVLFRKTPKSNNRKTWKRRGMRHKEFKARKPFSAMSECTEIAGLKLKPTFSNCKSLGECYLAFKKWALNTGSKKNLLSDNVKNRSVKLFYEKVFKKKKKKFFIEDDNQIFNGISMMKGEEYTKGIKEFEEEMIKLK